MPVEIKELVIRAVVGSGPEQVQGEQGFDGPAPQGGAVNGASLEAIVQECVRQVLRVLERRQER